jgi:hypothetical protein
MNPESIHIIRIIISVAIVIVPLRDMIVKKGRWWIQRISKIGWVLLAIAIANAFLNEYQFREKPLIYISKSPAFSAVGSDSVTMLIEVKNYKPGTAKNLRANYANISQVGDIFDTTNTSSYSVNESDIVPEGGFYTFINTMDYKIKAIPATCYFFFRLTYTDDKGEPQDSVVRQVFVLPQPPKLGDMIFEADPAQYSRVKELLIKTKQW